MSTVPVSGGVGDVYINPGEATSTKVKEEYEKWMKVIDDIFKKGEFTKEDYTDLKEAMQALKKLAQEGDKTTSPGQVYYMPKEMLEKLDKIFSMLALVGITTDKDLNTPFEIAFALAAMKELKNFKSDEGITFEMVVEFALGGLSNVDKTLQEMLYTNFILKANGQYDKKLSDLEEQLKLTKKILDTLKDIQNFRNRKIGAPGAGEIDWSKNPTEASPEVGEITDEDVQEILKYKQQLSDEMKELQKLRGIPPAEYTPPEAGSVEETLQNVLEDLDGITPPPDLPGMPKTEADWKKFEGHDFPPYMDDPPNSGQESALGEWAQRNGVSVLPLGTFLERAAEKASLVRKEWAISIGLDKTNPELMNDRDLSELISDVSEAKPELNKFNMKTWLLDSKAQDDLNKAGTATESFNDTQKEELRETQYNFETFVKIANSLMDSMKKILERYAQGIAR